MHAPDDVLRPVLIRKGADLRSVCLRRRHRRPADLRPDRHLRRAGGARHHLHAPRAVGARGRTAHGELQLLGLAAEGRAETSSSSIRSSRPDERRGTSWCARSAPAARPSPGRSECSRRRRPPVLVRPPPPQTLSADADPGRRAASGKSTRPPPPRCAPRRRRRASRCAPAGPRCAPLRRRSRRPSSPSPSPWSRRLTSSSPQHCDAGCAFIVLSLPAVR